jgi:asparagine synthase (glutamine-hydrolysing)
LCGITGIFNLTNQEPINPDRLYEANQTIFHRGPDEEGVYSESNVGLAMRRLSIIDLSGGQQPIANEDNTIHIVYNGEMYIHNELRTELQALGHQFRTRVDTEVILHAYEQWGIEGCLNRLRGMYAFAIWDSNEQALYLARDRMGIKPLYFAQHEGRLYFASEIRGILLHSNMPRAANLTALEAFMDIGFVTSPYTIFEGIQKLPPAHYLVAKNGHVSLHSYWELTYDTPPLNSEKEYIEQFYELLHESVMIRLMSEVPLGALLSGGIDSTILAAIMQKETEKSVKTISLGFESNSYDETDLILANAKALQTDHHHSTFTGNTLDEYPKAMYYLEEPLADAVFTTFYNLYRVCRRENLTVVLNGEGSDELLAGYFWHKGEAFTQPFLGLPYPLRALVANSPMVNAKGEGGRLVADILRAAPPVHLRYQTWLRTGVPHLGQELLSSQVKTALNGYAKQTLLDSWADYITPATGRSEMNKMLWLQSRTRMIDRSNHMVDRMSMAHSVEARVPFQDHKLWEFCAKMPTKLKIHGSYMKPIEKYVLREAGRGLIPEDTRTRKKKGLSAPYKSWLSQPRLVDWAETAFSESQLKKTGLFDPAAVQQLRRDHQAGAPDRATLLMGVLAIQTWAHLFLETPITATEPVL